MTSNMSILVFLLFSVFFLKWLFKRNRAVRFSPTGLTHTKQREYVGTKSYLDERGYLRFRDSDTLVHRYLAEKKLGRKLRRQEVVHHVDGNKRNNAASNLEIYNSWEEHDAVHRHNQLVYGTWHKPQS